ncbi:hypothetical protein QYF36_014343 [Acer negundo]|nr:hypothetical protein QYF36_014343 [Acer negundo]
MFQRYFPLHLQAYMDKYLKRLVKAFDPYIHIKFYKYSNDRFRSSKAYIAIENYLSSKSTDHPNLFITVDSVTSDSSASMSSEFRLTSFIEKHYLQ